tara:strand:+ start:97 stop:270 length:174 start_codon:yes stop_codon:yes gene_type:complete
MNKKTLEFSEEAFEDQIRREIKMCLENCACLGRDSYGAYIDKLTEYLIKIIKTKTNE